MTRPIARTFVFASIVTSVAFAQTGRRAVTAADYDRATKMLAQNLNGMVVGGTVTLPESITDVRSSADTCVSPNACPSSCAITIARMPGSSIPRFT